MTSPTPVNAYAVAVGTAPNANMVPFVTQVSPAPTNVIGPNGPFKIGQQWINRVANIVYELTSLSSIGGTVTATWAMLGSSGGALDTLSGNTGTATPSSGNIAVVGTGILSVVGSGSTLTISSSSTADVASVTGTANQVLASPTTGAVVVSLIGPYTPSTYALDGVLYGNGTSAIQATTAVPNGVLVTSNSNVPSLLANGTAGQVLTANTAAPPSWQTPASAGLTWEVNNAGGAAVVGIGNIVNSGTVTFTLPVSPAVGSLIGFILAPGGAQWQLTSSAVNSIYYGNSSTPAGSHFLESTSGTVGGSAILVAVATGTWMVVSTSINSGIQIV